MKKFIYEIHRVVTTKEGPFEINTETWIDATQEIRNKLPNKDSDTYTIKLVCKNPFPWS